MAKSITADQQRRAIQKAIRVLGAPELIRPLAAWKDYLVQLNDARPSHSRS